VPEGCLEQAAVKRAQYFAPQPPAGKSAFSPMRGGVISPPTKPERRAQHAPDAFSSGAVVEHPRFGRGIITSTNGEGEEKIAVVRFETEGEKKMFVAFAPLKIM
jgi:hypothetical protein